MGRKSKTPARTMVSFTNKELETLEILAHHYQASVSWVIRQITIGKLSALNPEEVKLNGA
jgi:hypothetical protein